MSFAANLKAAREKRGILSRDLAKAVGVTAAAYSGWERGKREPSLTSVRKICETLNVSADSLLDLSNTSCDSPLMGVTIKRNRLELLNDPHRKTVDEIIDGFLAIEAFEAEKKRTQRKPSAS